MNIAKIINNILVFFHVKNVKIQSFTYYIPSPPQRKSPYREKQFDKVFYAFINKGYEIIDVQTIPNPNPNHSGFWYSFVVKSSSNTAKSLSFEEMDFQEETLIELGENTSKLEYE